MDPGSRRLRRPLPFFFFPDHPAAAIISFGLARHLACLASVSPYTALLAEAGRTRFSPIPFDSWAVTQHGSIQFRLQRPHDHVAAISIASATTTCCPAYRRYRNRVDSISGNEGPEPRRVRDTSAT